MKLERISLQLADQSVLAFDLHPGLTVIEAAPGEEHDLVRALVGSLSTPGDGVHVEFALDRGDLFVAFRPSGGTHRVIDVRSHSDVTERHRRPGGGIDVLGPWQSATQPLQRVLVAGSAELQNRDPTEQWVARLAAVPPERLLATAEAEVEAEQELRRATEAARSAPGASALAERAAWARARADATERRHNRLRVATLAVGTTVPVAAVVGLNTLGTAGAMGLLGGTLALTAGCIGYERRLARAIEAETEAMRTLSGAAEAARTGAERAADTEPGDGVAAASGAQAPAGDLPAGLVDDDVRAELLAASERYHATSQAWQEVAGNVPAPWVLAQRERIRRSAELRASVLPGGGSDPEPFAPAPRPAALIAGLTGRAAANRARTGGTESLPLFLEDPLQGLDWAEKAPVLEFLGRLAGRQQVVLVTADEAVLSWARLEAMTGGLGVIASQAPIEPGGEPVEPNADAAGDEGVDPTAPGR